MSILNKKSNVYKISIWVLAFICLLVLYYSIGILNAWNIPYDDFPEYWAAGRLVSHGQNPYGIQNIIELRNAVGQSRELADHAAIFLYPPWALPFVIPFGVLPYFPSRILWLLINIIFLIISVERILRIFGGSPIRRWFIWIATLIFFPTTAVLIFGHLNPLFLLSFILFILLADRDKPTLLTDLLAGFCIASLTVKFHLHYLFLIAVLIWIFKAKRWVILAGTILSISCMMMISFAYDPLIFVQYLELLRTYPFDAWATPTLGMILRYLFGLDLFWLQFLPPVIGIIWFFSFYTYKLTRWQWKNELPLLMMISIITAAYGWTCDYIVLLIPLLYSIILLFKRLDKFSSFALLGFFVIINMLAFIFHSQLLQLNEFWLFWFAPMLMVWFLLVRSYSILSNLSIPNN